MEALIIGPVLSLLVALKVGDYNTKKRAAEIVELKERIELLQKESELRESELPKKVMATIVPMAKAVQKLNQQVGL